MWVTLFLLLLQENFRRQELVLTADIVVTMIIVLNVLVLIGAIIIIVWAIYGEMMDINKKITNQIAEKIDINIRKKLSSNVKNKLKLLAKSSIAHVKATKLEVQAEEARHAADQHHHGGSHSKRWNKLSVLTKLGGLRRKNQVKINVANKEEEVTIHADRLEKEANAHHLKRKITMRKKSVQGREKIMERLKHRAMIKKNKVLDKVNMFSSLTRKAKNSLIMVMQQHHYKEGEALCVQGAEANCLFVLIDGTCKCMVKFGHASVTSNEQKVFDFAKLDVFGESAVKQIKSVRTASIIATSNCTTLELSRKDFLQLQANGKLEQNQNVTIAVDSLRDNLRKQSTANEANHRNLFEKLKQIKVDNEKKEAAAIVLEKLQIKKNLQQEKMNRLMNGQRRLKQPKMKVNQPQLPTEATDMAAAIAGIHIGSRKNATNSRKVPPKPPPVVSSGTSRTTRIVPATKQYEKTGMNDLQTMEQGLVQQPKKIEPPLIVPQIKIDEICLIGYSNRVATIALKKFHLDVAESLNWLMSDPIELEEEEEEEEEEAEEAEEKEKEGKEEGK